MVGDEPVMPATAFISAVPLPKAVPALAGTLITVVTGLVTCNAVIAAALVAADVVLAVIFVALVAADAVLVAMFVALVAAAAALAVIRVLLSSIAVLALVKLALTCPAMAGVPEIKVLAIVYVPAHALELNSNAAAAKIYCVFFIFFLPYL